MGQIIRESVTVDDREFQVAGAAQLKDPLPMTVRLKGTLWMWSVTADDGSDQSAAEWRGVPTEIRRRWRMVYLERCIMHAACLLHVTGLHRVRTTMRWVGAVRTNDARRSFAPPVDAARPNHENTHCWTTIQTTYSQRASRPTRQSRRRKWIFMTSWSRDRMLHVFYWLLNLATTFFWLSASTFRCCN